MNEKKRLINALQGKAVDRVPVICPGGMMNAAITGVVTHIAGNHNTELGPMIEAAVNTRKMTGFENYGIPFCMTCESEHFGVCVSHGDKTVEPRVTEYNTSELKDIIESTDIKFEPSHRDKVIMDSIKALKNDEIPVIGNITGPFSTATSIVDPLKFFKMLRKAPEDAYGFIEHINKYLMKYAEEMILSGADVIAVSDPTATGEILGMANFNKFVLPMYHDFFSFINSLETPTILHICGNALNILESLNKVPVNALSFDSIVSVKLVKEKVDKPLMGNISTLLLQNGPPERIVNNVKFAVYSGVSIVSPACGLGMETPVENLKAMTEYVKGNYHGQG